MPITLPSAWRPETQRIHQQYPWQWLWEIEADRTAVARTLFRVTAGPGIVTYAGMTFYPLPLTQTPIKVSGEGDLPQVDLTISHTQRILAPYFEVGSGFLDRPAMGHLVNLVDLSQALSFPFEVRRADVSHEGAVIRLEMPNFFRRLVPQERYSPQRCRHRFGGAACGYVINAAAAFTTCAKHPQDCILRGADMASRNLPRLQPGRFGGFLGIPES